MHQADLLGMLPRLYRDDPWLIAILGAIGAQLDRLDEKIKILHENRYFDGMTFALPIWERIAAIKKRAGMTEEERRAALRGKWLTNQKCDQALLQSMADSWRDNSVAVGFDDGFITLTVLDPVVLPMLGDLMDVMEEVKPAHLPFLVGVAYDQPLYIAGAAASTDTIILPPLEV